MINKIIKDYIILNNGCLVHQDRMKTDGVLLGKEETKRSLKKILKAQREEFRKMVRKLANEYGKTDETLHYSQALSDILKELK